MLTTKETIIPIHSNFTKGNVKRAAHLAGTLAQNLQPGEYLIRDRTIPVIFVRVGEWTPLLLPQSFDLKHSGKLFLNDQTEIQISQVGIDSILKHKHQFRVVLVADNGFSSFMIDLNASA